MYCAFIDFAKAFDTVWRKGLWYKLLGNEINGNMYKVIFNMYSGIKYRVLYNGEMSEYFPCNIEIRQGVYLSLFLFSIYLNDLQQFLEERNVCGFNCISDEIEGEFDIYLKLFVLLYADDTVLFYGSASYLQLQLNMFCEY